MGRAVARDGARKNIRAGGHAGADDDVSRFTGPMAQDPPDRTFAIQRNVRADLSEVITKRRELESSTLL